MKTRLLVLCVIPVLLIAFLVGCEREHLVSPEEQGNYSQLPNLPSAGKASAMATLYAVNNIGQI